MAIPRWVIELLEKNEYCLIESLDLSERGINTDDLIELTTKIIQYNVKIKLLSLYRNNIDDEAITYLVKIQDRLEEINLRLNNVTDDGAIQLIRSSVKKLNLAENCLSDACVKVFIEEGLQVKINFAKNKRITQDLFPKVQEKLKSNNEQQSSSSSAQVQKIVMSAATSSTYSFYSHVDSSPGMLANNKARSNESLSEADKADLKVKLTELVTSFMREHNCTETAVISALLDIVQEMRSLPPYPPASKATGK